MNKLLEETKKAEDQFESTPMTKKEKVLYESYKENWDIYLKLHDDKFMPLSNAMKSTEADKMLDEMEPQYDLFTKYIIENVALHKQSSIDFSNAADRMYAQSILLTYVLLILAIIFSVSFGIIITRAIANPLRILVDAAKTIAAGDLTQEVKASGNDEVGILSSSFNTMVKNLRELVIKVLQTAQHVSVSSQQISSSAQQINSTAQEVSSTVQQIAKGAESTAQRVEETSKVMEQMGSSVSQMAASSQQTAAAATQANSSAQKGRDAAGETIKKMEKIFKVSTDSALVVNKLGERSEEIVKIIDVITNIADQTNLLALNAAIEAARAGEAGRGFAVVAEEVRKLAESSSKAADEIGSLIKEVSKDTVLAVKGMDETSKEVIEGKELIAGTAQSLEEILKAAGNTATMVQQISAATQQMAAGSKQVVKSIDEIASSAEEAASATEQASASTEEMTASMEEMAASAQELANMAIELRELVGKFKTGAEIEKEVSAVKPKKIEIPKEIKAGKERIHKHGA